MSWVESIGEPLCPTAAEAEEYVTAGLKDAVPANWRVEHSTPSLYWRVVRTQIPPGEWELQEYGVCLDPGLKLLFFTHDNDDKGPRALRTAFRVESMIEAAQVRRYGVSACLEHIMSNHRPNEWGYT